MRTIFFTGAGDAGTVRMGGRRVVKSAPLFAVLGELDSLNSVLGWVRASVPSRRRSRTMLSIDDVLTNLQELLFIAQAELAAQGYGMQVTHRILPEHTTYLEEVIGRIDALLPSRTTFVLPGGGECGARLDVARTVARELERHVAAVPRIGRRGTSPALRMFLNRFSSVLFALARLSNHVDGVVEQAPTYRLRTRPSFVLE